MSDEEQPEDEFSDYSEQNIYKKEIVRAKTRDQEREKSAERRAFYEALPVGLLTRMLDCEAGELSRREFDFCFQEFAGEGIFWARYKTFQTPEQLKTHLINTEPVSINVGPVGGSPSALWRAHASQRQQWGDRTGDAFYATELVLDIDLKDYNNVRTCPCTETMHNLQRCSYCGKLLFPSERYFERQCNCKWQKFKNQICATCWSFARSAMVLVDYILKKKWGIHEFFFVFSGGKGFHCWILDEQVRAFNTQQRQELVASFQPWTDELHLKTENYTVDPLFGASDFEDLLTLLFEHTVLNTGIFNIEHENTRRRIVEYFDVESSELDDKLEALFKVCDECVAWSYTSEQVWRTLMEYNFKTNEPARARTIQRRFLYAYTFPRVDALVSTQLSHARKLPFSPHPTSGCVAIPLLPLTPERIFEFTPSLCPNLTDLPQVSDVVAEFSLQLALFTPELSEIRYCEATFPVVPNLLDLLGYASAGKILRALCNWCDSKVQQRCLFADYTEYSAHACTVCDKHIILEPQNTLNRLIRRLCWIEGVYKAVLAECMTLAFLQRCAAFGMLTLDKVLVERIAHLMAN